MRAWTWIALGAVLACSSAQAQAPASDGALDPESYVALSADDQAQLTLGGFRRYLERIQPTDAALYRELNPRLDELESRDLAADVVFWTATGLGVAALITAIPVYVELPDLDPGVAIGLVVGGVSTFLLGVIIQAIVRPGHDDLVRLIDFHDELVGRR